MARSPARVPPLVLPSTAGCEVDLAHEAQSRNVVLACYPGDREGWKYPQLAGCTPEACAFRDAREEFERLGAVLFGVASHPTSRQEEFVAREALSIELLSDESGEFGRALGVSEWETETGERFLARTTFLIERGGRIADVFEDVVVGDHVPDVLDAVRRLCRPP